MKHKLKLIIFACLSTFISAIVLCLVLEIVLRFLPVNQGLHSMPVNQDSSIFRFEPNRTLVWSRTWNFSVRNVVKTNNYGFVSNIDYDPQLSSPLIAIIGDSYIEAARVPWEQTGAARLHKHFGSTCRVYAFGASGAPLSQYLAYSGYVHKEFHPDRLIILVVGNDFDESLMKYNGTPGFHYFVENSRAELVLKRVDYDVRLWRKFVRKSALGMYLATNLNVVRAFYTLKHALTQERFVGNTSADANEKRISDSQRVVDAFLAMLPDMSHLEPSNIIFVLDGIRPQMYNEETLKSAQGSYYDIMRQYFMKNAEKQGFEVIDMQPVFIEHYKKYGQRFEFPNDNHWNSLGHGLFANIMAESKTLLLLPENMQ